MSLKGANGVEGTVLITEKIYRAKKEFDEGFLRPLVALAYMQFVNKTKNWVHRYESPRDECQGKLNSCINMNIFEFDEKTDFLNCVGSICYKSKTYEEELSEKNLKYGTFTLAFSDKVFYTDYKELVEWAHKIKEHYKISDKLYNLMTDQWTNVEYSFPNTVDVNKLNYKTCLFFNYQKFKADENTLNAPVLKDILPYAVSTQGLFYNRENTLDSEPYKSIKFFQFLPKLQFDLRLNGDEAYNSDIAYYLCGRNVGISYDELRISYVRPFKNETIEKFYSRSKQLLEAVARSYRTVSGDFTLNLDVRPYTYGSVIGIIYSNTQNIKPTGEIFELISKLKEEMHIFVAFNLSDFDVYVRKLKEKTLLDLLTTDISVYRKEYDRLDAIEEEQKKLKVR